MITLAKLAQSTIKYLIEAEFLADGLVEKPDIIGAIFGQTEGLLGQDLDLRELQRTGRVGRIDVEISSDNGKTIGKITIPSSLDSSETALIAASLETIERIGPCNSEVKTLTVKDVREDKRNFMMKRAKDILQNMFSEEMPLTSTLSEKIRENVRTTQITEYENLPCGPELLTSDDIIIVEGRADVLNLLKNGVKNAIAIGGATVPPAIINLTKERVATLFVDGDRAGDLIVKELVQFCDVDYVAKAPVDKEVEELTKKEIFKSLRERTSVEQYKPGVKAKELKEFIQEAPREQQNIPVQIV
jgi:DNA primase